MPLFENDEAEDVEEAEELEAQDLADIIAGLLEGAGEEDLADELGGGVARTTTFEEAGLLTRDKGVVVRLANGQAFQITVAEDHRSRR